MITKLQGLENYANLVYRDKSKQIDLLNTVLLSSEVDYAKRDLNSSDMETHESTDEEALPAIKRTQTSLSALSGGDSMAYMEFKRVHFKKNKKTNEK